jgi:hypothetical protein
MTMKQIVLLANNNDVVKRLVFDDILDLDVGFELQCLQTNGTMTRIHLTCAEMLTLVNLYGNWFPPDAIDPVQPPSMMLRVDADVLNMLDDAFDDELPMLLGKKDRLLTPLEILGSWTLANVSREQWDTWWADRKVTTDITAQDDHTPDEETHIAWVDFVRLGAYAKPKRNAPVKKKKSTFSRPADNW